MNCKPGDLAIVVKSLAGNDGKIVTVKKWIGHVIGFRGNDRWEIDRTLPTLFGSMCNHMRDSYMRPIDPPADSEQTETERELQHE